MTVWRLTRAVLFSARAAGGALLKGELVSDEGEENALNADLQPSVHWDQNDYDILVKQEGLRKQHSVHRPLHSLPSLIFSQSIEANLERTN
jgi:hypothetical protein